MPADASISRLSPSTTSIGSLALYWVKTHAPPIPKCGIRGYTVLSTAASFTPSALAAILFSKMGFGDSVWDFLTENSSYRYHLGFLALIIASILYLLDFYCPPHLPHKHFRLWAGDEYFGRALLAIAALIFLLAACLNPEYYPQIPLLISIMLSPAFVYLARALVRPRHAVQHDAAGDINIDDIGTRIQVLQNITGDEKDEHNFFRGALAGFWLTSVAMLIPWVVWEERQGGYTGADGNTDAQEAIERFKWSTPMFCAIANFIWGCFVALRIRLEKEYDSTDFYKSMLEENSGASSLHSQIGRHMLQAHVASQSSGVNSPSPLTPAGDRNGSMLHKSGPSGSSVLSSVRSVNASSLNRLALCIKGVGFILITLLCGCYAAQMVLSMNQILSEILIGLILTLLLGYSLFVWLTMGRMIMFLGDWLTDLPLYKMGKDIVASNWFLACVVIICYPAVPFIFFISWVNQRIRRCRGLYVKYAEATGNHISSAHRERFQNMQELTLTPRVNVLLAMVQDRDMKPVVTWTYMWCAAYIITSCSYTFASVLLAWCVQMLEGVSPALVVAMTFILGVVLFLVPVTPGMLVYIFGGLVISPTWPDALGGWTVGCIVNILVSWVLKLLACAIQQKIIGEQLGNILWVRQQCMLHKRFIRTLELILKKPGWSVGKVAVLCGGPDWPVSVGAGLLRLPVLQMELGTLPIIFFVIPCGMTGSAYVCEDECSPGLPAMMMMASVGVSMLMYMLIAWTAQATFERNEEELTRKLAKHVDLEWLDYRSEEINRLSAVPFAKVNPCVRNMFFLGSLLHMTIAHIYFWVASYIQGAFEIQYGIDELVWYDGEWYGEGPKGLITNTLAFVWALYGLGCVLCFQFFLWNSCATSGPRREAATRLDTQEAAWKDEFLQQAAQQAEGRAATHNPPPDLKDHPACTDAAISGMDNSDKSEDYPRCMDAAPPEITESADLFDKSQKPPRSQSTLSGLRRIDGCEGGRRIDGCEGGRAEDSVKADLPTHFLHDGGVMNEAVNSISERCCWTLTCAPST